MQFHFEAIPFIGSLHSSIFISISYLATKSAENHVESCWFWVSTAVLAQYVAPPSDSSSELLWNPPILHQINRCNNVSLSYLLLLLTISANTCAARTGSHKVCQLHYRSETNPPSPPRLTDGSRRTSRYVRYHVLIDVAIAVQDIFAGCISCIAPFGPLLAPPRVSGI